LRVRAFAKINLSLRVLGVRSDGYHELRTVFQSLALHDTLTFAVARGPFAFSCDEPACPAGADNLVCRAAARVWKAAGRRGPLRGVRVHLIKRIPMQAGLGGGSSDAAAAIGALGRLWRVDDRRLREIGRTLGADIPFFFEGGTVLGLERGDLLFPLDDRPAAWVVLAVPPFGVDTAEAFRWYDASPPARRQHGTIGRNEFSGNDLESVVTARFPEIRSLARALERAGASHAGMSGSGSAVFGLFSSRPDAVAAARAVSARYPARVLVTRTVDRRTYQRRLPASQPIG
jgi:4-diphosphocytidyl-2-C-methyl-D-erythritol kinase